MVLLFAAVAVAGAVDIALVFVVFNAEALRKSDHTGHNVALLMVDGQAWTAISDSSQYTFAFAWALLRAWRSRKPTYNRCYRAQWPRTASQNAGNHRKQLFNIFL